MATKELTAHIADAVTNRGLKLILNTTEQCNLRCKYCYESFVLGRMPPDVVRGVLALVEKRASNGLDWLEVEFFGGEPLAAWNVVETLSEGLREICDRTGVKLLGSMTTNATLLTPSRLRALVNSHFTFFQITLDGPKEIHDSRRINSHGKGSFDGVWSRLLMLKNYVGPTEVMVRLHFDQLSASKLTEPPSFIEVLANTFMVPDKRFILHFNPIEPWGNSVDDDIHFFTSPARINEALDSLLTHARKVGIPSAQMPQAGASLQKTGESGHVVCYAARANSFVIRSDGRVSKCTVAFDDDRNTVGRLLPNGDLLIDQNRHLPWLRGLVSGDQESLRCPAIGFVWI